MTKWILAIFGGLALFGVARRVRAILPIAKDIRSPAMMLVLPPVSPRTLKMWRKLLGQPTKIAAGVRSEGRIASFGGESVDVVLFDPEERSVPSAAMLWIHGGGLVIGCPEKENDECSRMASELGILVVSVRYRRAPEDPFPAGLNDCHTALRWMHREAEPLGIDPSRVIVAGASAGGGLAAALCQLALDKGTVPIAFQALKYPMLDDRTSFRPDHQGRDRLAWTPASNRFGWTSYLGHAPNADPTPPYAVPARRDDLTSLPPAWIGVGDLDLFYEEASDYAERLQRAGVPCELTVPPGMFHGADVVNKDAPTVVRFREAMMAAVAAVLARSN